MQLALNKVSTDAVLEAFELIERAGLLGALSIDSQDWWEYQKACGRDQERKSNEIRPHATVVRAEIS